jgi:hypothetical protein
MGDWDLIRAELRAAEDEERAISDLAARVIATQFHGGQSSAMYAFSSTGIIEDHLDSEIHEAMRDSDEEEERRALEALDTYCKGRSDKSRQANWSTLRW